MKRIRYQKPEMIINTRVIELRRLVKVFMIKLMNTRVKDARLQAMTLVVLVLIMLIMPSIVKGLKMTLSMYIQFT